MTIIYDVIKIVVNENNKIDNNSNLIAFTNKVFDKVVMEIRDIKPDDYINSNTNNSNLDF
jgi:hypothetical protein